MDVPTRLEFRNDGVRLVADAYGDPDARPVLFLHGGGQTRHAWHRTALAVARRGYYAVALDLRGHGESDWSPDGAYEGARFVSDVLAVAGCFTRKPIVVGASLGGMIAMLAEGLERPGSFDAIVLVDVAHRMRDAGVERIVAFMRDGFAGFASLDDAAAAVARYAGRRESATQDGLKKNLRLREDGRWYWHWDPRIFETADVEEARRSGRFVEAARAIGVPVLLLRGTRSDVVDETLARELVDLIANARYVDVAGARHMLAGDENDAFASAVVAFLDEASGVRPARNASTPDRDA